MVAKKALGSHFYLWHSSKKLPTLCILSAHGAQLSSDSNFNLKKIKVGFYTYGNHKLRARLVAGLQPPTQMEDGLVCPEHILSKYQGRHSNNQETYEQIKEFVKKYDVAVLTVRNRQSLFVSGKGQVRLPDGLRLTKKHLPAITTFHCLVYRVQLKAEIKKVM